MGSVIATRRGPGPIKLWRIAVSVSVFLIIEREQLKTLIFRVRIVEILGFFHRQCYKNPDFWAQCGRYAISLNFHFSLIMPAPP